MKTFERHKMNISIWDNENCSKSLSSLLELYLLYFINFLLSISTNLTVTHPRISSFLFYNSLYLYIICFFIFHYLESF